MSRSSSYDTEPFELSAIEAFPPQGYLLLYLLLPIYAFPAAAIIWGIGKNFFPFLAHAKALLIIYGITFFSILTYAIISELRNSFWTLDRDFLSRGKPENLRIYLEEVKNFAIGLPEAEGILYSLVKTVMPGRLRAIQSRRKSVIILFLKNETALPLQLNYLINGRLIEMDLLVKLKAKKVVELTEYPRWLKVLRSTGLNKIIYSE
ncbi:hypothetical protein ACFL35_13990 [Candidatus Riflebacteria bacterium]